MSGGHLGSEGDEFTGQPIYVETAASADPPDVQIANVSATDLAAGEKTFSRIARSVTNFLGRGNSRGQNRNLKSSP